MERVNDIIKELETQVEPLREQKEKLEDYNLSQIRKIKPNTTDKKYEYI